MASRSGFVRTSDIRPLMALAGQLGDLPCDVGVRMQHLLKGLCAHYGAFSGVATVSTHRRQDYRHRTVWTFGHEDAGQLAALQYFFRYGGPPDPCRAPVLDLLDRTTTQARAAVRRQLAPDVIWYASPHVQEVRRPAGVDHCLYSFLPLPGTGCFGAITLSRPWGERRVFSERDRVTLELLHEGLRWLYRPRALEAATRVAALSPRQRDVLEQVKRGRGEKEIAQVLGLSRHTVHEYLAELYRRMEVRSRGELLAMWM